MLSLKVYEREVMDTLERLGAKAEKDRPKLLFSIASALSYFYRRNWEQGKDVDGIPFQPLSEKYKEEKLKRYGGKSSKILYRTGLMMGYGWMVDMSYLAARVGTLAEYGHYHGVKEYGKEVEYNRKKLPLRAVLGINKETDKLVKKIIDNFLKG